MKPLRFGCIGCGPMGALHTLNSRFVPGLEVVAFADIDIAKAQQYLEDFGGEYATDSADTLFQDASLDGVFIITGERFHPSLGVAAARAGKHIFMEKPIGRTVEEALEVEKAVRENNVKYLIGFCNRLAPAVKKAHQLLPAPWMTLAQSGSTVTHQACHHLDLMVHLFHRSPLQSVFAGGGHAYNNDEHLPADSFIAVLKFEDGSQASLAMHGKALNPNLGKYSMQFFGRDRTVYLAQKFMEVHLSSNGKSWDFSYAFQGVDATPLDKSNPDAHYKNSRGPHGYMGHYEELVALCDAIRNDTESPITVEEGRHVLQVEKAILESVETGKLIDFKEFLGRWNAPPPVFLREQEKTHGA